MYFPTSAARQLSSVPALPNVPLEDILSLEPSPRKSLFCAVTQRAISVWRVRVRSAFTPECMVSESLRQPSTPLAYLARSEISLTEHGDNLAVTWSPDGSRIVIQVSSVHHNVLLCLIVICSRRRSHISCWYWSTAFPTLQCISRQISHQVFSATSLPAQGRECHFNHSASRSKASYARRVRFSGNRSLLQVEPHLDMHFQPNSVSPRKNHLAFTTSSPPAIQRIPWPSYDDADDNDRSRRSLFGYDTWVLSDHELPWLVDSDGTCYTVYSHYIATRVRLIHLGSHCPEDLVLNFRSGDVGNFGWKSLLCAIGGELTNGRDRC